MLLPGCTNVITRKCPYSKVPNKRLPRLYFLKKKSALTTDEEPSKKRFRESGGGKKCKAPEVREAMFKCFINVRGVLNGRLPIKIFRSKSQQVYDEWLKQQPEPVPEHYQLKFSKHWMQD